MWKGEERWNEGERGKVEEETMPLKDTLRPACGSTQKTRDIKLMVKTGFSSIKCTNAACAKVTVSSTWRCRCRRQWIKCPAHVHESLQVKKNVGIKKQQKGKERLRAKRGVDEPMPQRRGSKAEASQSFEGSKQVGSERALFKKVSLLDLRSPHILRRQNELGQEEKYCTLCLWILLWAIWDHCTSCI